MANTNSNTAKSSPIHNVYIEIGKEFRHDEEYVQVHAQLLKKLHERIIRSFCTDKEFPNRNYLITGRRGSGKSTFLENLLKMLLNNNCTRKINQDICFAKLLEYDPSASTGGENYFILNVFAALKSEFNKLNTCECSSQAHPHIHTCWQLIKKLSRGLANRSQGRAPLSEMTADVVSELTLENPDRDECIRELFDQLINTMCEMRNISAYIITIDDSDTSSHQCFRVMEALRLYLNHPKIIVLMTGDKNMLLERIREHHFKEFDTQYHQHEGQRKDIRMSAVVAHAGQYLLKLFPLYNQHELQNLLTLSRKAKPIILHVRRITKDKENQDTIQDKSLRDIVTQAFAITISDNITDIKPFVDQFFCLPLRAILQVLKYWTDDHLWDILFSPTPPCTQCTRSGQYSEKQCITYSVRMALKRVLQTEISSSHYNFESLQADDGRTFFSLLLRHCRDMDDLEHGFYLSGDMGGTKEDRHITMLLAVTFGKIIRNLDGFISYLLYGPATVTLYAKAVEQYRRSPQKQNINTLDKLQHNFDNYLHVGSWQSATRWARHANMIWCYDAGFEGIHSGILRLRHPYYLKSLRTYAENMMKEIKSAYNPDNPSPKSHDSFSKIVSLAVSMSRSNERDNSYFISIYSFLAFILKCLNVYKEYSSNYTARDEKNQENVNKEQIKKLTCNAITKIISKSIPIKSCRNPEWLIDKQKSEEQDKSYNHESLELNFKNSDYRKYLLDEAKLLADEIFGWCQSNFTDEDMADDLTPSKMGDIWSNMYYGLKQKGYNIDIKTLQPVYAKGRGNDRLKGYYGHLKQFKHVIDFFIESLNNTEQGTLGGWYRMRLHEFPLTLKLKKAYQEFVTNYIP